MFKPFILTIAGLAIASMAVPTQAIAPDTDKVVSCGRFTANKYRVDGNDITVKVTRRTSSGTYLDWNVKPFRASGYCFVTNANRTSQWVVERGPRPETVALGPKKGCLIISPVMVM
jgi:hypothetical protein